MLYDNTKYPYDFASKKKQTIDSGKLANFLVSRLSLRKQLCIYE